MTPDLPPLEWDPSCEAPKQACLHDWRFVNPYPPARADKWWCPHCLATKLKAWPSPY